MAVVRQERAPSSISNTSRPPRTISECFSLKPGITLPFSDTDFTYLFSRERFFAKTVNRFPFPTSNDTFGNCGAPSTYSPLAGFSG